MIPWLERVGVLLVSMLPEMLALSEQSCSLYLLDDVRAVTLLWAASKFSDRDEELHFVAALATAHVVKIHEGAVLITDRILQLAYLRVLYEQESMGRLCLCPPMTFDQLWTSLSYSSGNLRNSRGLQGCHVGNDG